MKLGLVIVTYNRPSYLKQCLESLNRADIPQGTVMIVVDDASTDPETKEILKNLSYEVIQKSTNTKISDSLQVGFDHLVHYGCDFFMNLDSDAIVRKDFIQQIRETLLYAPVNIKIATGFNCRTRNLDGTERHIVTSEGEGWNIKNSIGGINMYFSVVTYLNHVKPALQRTVGGGNWDHQACISAGGAICTVPSVIQHIGINSALGHEHPDVADDFKPLSLPNVTLIGVDTYPERLQKACDISTKDIHFGEVKMITDVPIKSKEQYSKYILSHLHKHIETDYLLIIQYDGYVLNWKAWDNNWLQYDYIGAPWWYTDGKNVGNGGFSLRSKRLMEITATDRAFAERVHPEDDVICRQRRTYLETQYGIKFAPDEVARKFSIEGFNQPNKRWSGEFGFHGTQVELKPPDGRGKVAVIEQYFGIGDVIFCANIAQNLLNQGYKILWPVLPEYVDGLNRAYPDFTFIDCNVVKIDYNNKNDYTHNNIRLIPIRWTYDTMKVPFKDCMKSKYDFMGIDWKDWTKTSFERDTVKEDQLFKELELIEGESYTLVNENFRSDNRGKVKINAQGKVVHMTIKPGYSIFDWAKVIENATQIHTVSTSIIYLMELLDMKAEIHIYIRRPDEQNHDNYSYLLTRHKYILEP